VAASACFVLVAWRTGIRPFLGARRDTPHTPHEAPWTMLAGPLALAAATLTIGLVPGAVDALAGSAADAVRGAPLHLHLHLWHGWTPELAASGLTLLLGALLIALAPAAVALGRSLRGLATALGPDRGYARTLGAVTGFAAWQTRALQSGSLRRYLVIAVLTVSALFVLSFARHTPPLTFLGPTPLSLPVALLGGLIIIATIAATLSTSRLGAVAAMGVVGFSVAVLFILFGAPDLAMTQLVVETLSVVLLVSAFYFLPPFARRSTWRGRARDLTVSVFAGIVVTLLVLLATGVQVHAPISSYFAETSVPLGHGRNIVNVILVDYRALDTLGEITVLAVAGLGSLALLRLRAPKRRPRP
jgi:multicomponent Na+:H+ antiporter subunit A